MWLRGCVRGTTNVTAATFRRLLPCCELRQCVAHALIGRYIQKLEERFRVVLPPVLAFSYHFLAGKLGAHFWTLCSELCMLDESDESVQTQLLLCWTHLTQCKPWAVVLMIRAVADGTPQHKLRLGGVSSLTPCAAAYLLCTHLCVACLRHQCCSQSALRRCGHHQPSSRAPLIQHHARPLR